MSLPHADQDEECRLDDLLTDVSVFPVSGEDMQLILDISTRAELADHYRVICGELVIGTRNGLMEEYVRIVVMERGIPIALKIDDNQVVLHTRRTVIQRCEEALCRQK